MWKHIQESVDTHGATSHTLRHSYLTYAVGATTDFKTIQGISGHSDVFTLMNRYAHPQEEKKIELSEEMTKILTQKSDSSETLWVLICKGLRAVENPKSQILAKSKNIKKLWKPYKSRLPEEWSIADSNRWPPHCQCGALPAALMPLNGG